MVIISVKISDDEGTEIEEKNMYVSLEIDNYDSNMRKIYYEYSGFFKCMLDKLNMTIYYNKTTYDIHSFNMLKCSKFNRKTKSIYKKIQLNEYCLTQIDRAEKDKNKKFNSDKCTICLELYEEMTFLLPCLHKFHTDCIINSLNKNNKCPVCRLSFNECVKY